VKRRRRLLIVAALVCFAIFTTIARPNDVTDGSEARKREAGELTHHLADLHVRRIYVPDFVDTSRGYTILARFLAATFSKFMTDDANGLAILSRSEAHKFLDKNHWTDRDLSRPQVFSQFAATFSVDAVLFGEVSTGRNLYTIDFMARDLAGKALFRDQFQHAIDPAIVGVVAAEQGQLGGTVFGFAGLDDVSEPKCKSCPPPDYSESARKQRMQGDLALCAIVTPNGKIERVVVTQTVDKYLDRAAIEIVKTWKLEPAHDADGHPVAALTPLEVLFRMRP
jgi:TonB family protein